MSGVETVVALQSVLGPDWRAFATALSAFGGSPVLLLLVAALLLVGGFSRFVPLALVFLGTAVLVGILKLGLAEPRPWLLSEAVVPWSDSAGFGMPSGHAANTVIMAGGLWLLIGSARRGTRGIALYGSALVLLGSMGATRVYLGAHTPAQVVVGAGVGLGVLVGWSLGARPVAAALARHPSADVWLAGGLPAGLLALRAWCLARLPNEWPEAWVERLAANGQVSIAEARVELDTLLTEPTRQLHIALLIGFLLATLLVRRLSPDDRAAVEERCGLSARLAGGSGGLAVGLALAMAVHRDGLILWLVAMVVPLLSFVLLPIGVARVQAKLV